MNVDLIYLAQIVILVLSIGLLCLCIFFTWYSRQALNGLARSLLATFVAMIAQMILLIVRRIDDVFHILDANSLAVLSSLVAILSFVIVLLFSYDLAYVYRHRDLFAADQMRRKAREEELEEMYRKHEIESARRNWIDETLKRFL